MAETVVEAASPLAGHHQAGIQQQLRRLLLHRLQIDQQAIPAVRGIAKLESKLIILLDLNKALANIGSGLKAMADSLNSVAAEPVVTPVAVEVKTPEAKVSNSGRRRKEKAAAGV